MTVFQDIDQTAGVAHIHLDISVAVAAGCDHGLGGAIGGSGDDLLIQLCACALCERVVDAGLNGVAGSSHTHRHQHGSHHCSHQQRNKFLIQLHRKFSCLSAHFAKAFSSFAFALSYNFFRGTVNHHICPHVKKQPQRRLFLSAAAVCKVFVEITSGPCGWSW